MAAQTWSSRLILEIGGHDEALATTIEPKAEELASDLEKLGPTFIKLGQLLSTRGDLLPEPYLEALARLQDHIEPFSFDEVEQIVSTELGARLSKLFAEFDREPTAAASLAQVHRARMRDGRMVVVKVQRPGVRETIVKDLEALEEITDFIDAHTEMGKRYEFSNMLSRLTPELFCASLISSARPAICGGCAPACASLSTSSFPSRLKTSPLHACSRWITLRARR